MIRPESIRYKLIGLALTMSFAVLFVSGISGYILYQTYISQTAERLSETAKSNSRLIDAFADYEFKHSEALHSKPPNFELTLSLIKSAHEQLKFGQSGEFTLAKKKGKQIVFLMRNRLSGMDIPDPVAFDLLEKAEPMRKALSGNSGWMIGKDYRGVEVMAAFEPVEKLNLGIVAKIDMQEIRSPFIKAAAVMIALAIVISITALGIFYWISRQISEKFEDSTQQFNRLAKFSRDVIYRMSIPDGRYEYINSASIELFGLTPEEFYKSPKKIQDLIHPDWHAYFADQWQRLLQGNIPPTYEYQIITPAGETKWIGQSNVLVTNNKGKPIAIEGIVKDITQQKQYTKALMREKEIAQSYLDIAGTMMLALDMNGNISLLNQKACEVLGWHEQDALGKNWVENFLPKQVKEEVSAVFKQILSGKVERVEFHKNSIITKEGEERIIAWHNRLLRDHDGQTIIGILCSGEDITQQKIQEDKITHQAHFDSLTNLPNRFLSLDRLTQLINEAKREHDHVAVLFIDLDDFKKVNDTLGHETGDELLIQASAKLLREIRAGDTVGRLGGDEFLLLLGGIKSPTDAQLVATSMLENFREPFRINNREMILTTSIGIAIYPEDGNDASQLLRNSDLAMYHSKERGRNTYSFFTESMNQEISRRMTLEEQMHGALDRKEFSVLYQPQFKVSSSKIIGAEALLRWTNPHLGSVSPVEFIPVAEQSGLIVRLGLYVLEQALKNTKNWCQLTRQFRISVNLSPRQFRDPGLLNNIRQLMERYTISANHLELEITEGVLMSGHNHITNVLSELSKQGVNLAMDDFGTGYSSLSYLRNYPFNSLKIDKSFINDISVDPADRELINATIAMSHGLSLKVIAEGVETQEQLDYLDKLGCDYVQGYFFSKPVKAEELTELLKQK